MTGAERKRIWRQRNPEKSREHERVRARARRDGYWNRDKHYVALQAQRDYGTPMTVELRSCASAVSYRRYENSMKRFMQRLRYAFAGTDVAPEVADAIARFGAITGDDRQQLAAMDRLINELDQKWFGGVFAATLGPLGQEV
jgi:hypothetical protein